MDISVVLGTYNRAASLQTTLETFSKLVVDPRLCWELLVVDNNSTDRTPEVVRSFAKTVNLSVCYIFERQQGRSAALNAGIAEAKGKIVAFTDDDVLIDSEWLSRLTQTFDTFDCAAVAGRVIPQWSHAKPDWLEMKGQFAVVNFDLGDDFKEIRTPPLGANSAFRKEMFTKYGLFRLDLGVNGSKHTITCDDTEFGERLIRGGERIVYCPSAVIYHPVDPSRTTKAYFLSWHYYNGVSLTRTAGLRQEGIFWFGAPRWLCREFLENLLEWLLTFGAKRRFQQKLKAYRSFGILVENRRLSRAKSPGSIAEEPQNS
jgi:glucosyl-dolichyl phosphate glucuronosyltransferase